MATYSSAKLFVCFFASVTLFVEGAKTARVVYPRLLEERSSNGGMVVKVHDDLTLNLRKGSVAARQLRVLTEENGRPVTHFYNGEDIERNLYEDQEQAASVMVTKAGSGVRMEGLVSPIHRIQPMAVSARSKDGVVPHEIHEIEQKEMLDKTLTYRLKDTVPSERSWNTERTNVPPSVTVEVFIVLDRWHHRHFNSTEHALWYLCVTVNAANLRYSDTSNPRIQLLLTGVEKAVKEEYVVTEKSGYLYDDGTLTMFRVHAVLQRTTYGRPDVVYLMTGRDVFTYHNGKITDAGLGIGFMSGVCTDFYVALGEDKPGLFSGMHTFSHEMAHLLGAKHDGDGPDLRFPGHPGAENCPWDLGHIMSYRNTGPAHHRFSTCSLDQMRLVISRAGPACWKVTAEGESVRNMYPGMVVPFKEFCSVLPSNKNFTYDHATVYQANCKVRCYFYSLMVNPVFPEWGSYKVMYDYTADALDYMQCGEHHVCIRAICQDHKGFPANTTTIADTPEPATVTETTTTKRTTRTTRRMFAWRHRTTKWYP